MFIEETELENHLKTIPRAAWNRLLDLIPRLEQKEVFGHWQGPEHSLYLVPEWEVEHFFDEVHRLGLMVVFDWSRWEKGRLAWHNKVFDFSTMTLSELCKMITLLIRGDRFNEGLLVEAFDRGIVLRILKAIKLKLSPTI